MMTLTGQTAIITGASKGIGLAIATTLAQHGVQVLLNARDANALEIARTHILTSLAEPVPIELFPGSVADPRVVEAMVGHAVATWGRLDILINNAGVSPQFKLLQELDIDEIDQTIDINLKGPIYGIKYALPHMVHQQKGTIININSMAGQKTYPYSAVYCASKFGLTALTECVAEEQQSNNIKLIGIHPGAVDTPIWQSIEPHTQQDPNRMLDAQDIADAVLFVLLQPNKTIVNRLTLNPFYSENIS